MKPTKPPTTCAEAGRRGGLALMASLTPSERLAKVRKAGQARTGCRMCHHPATGEQRLKKTLPVGFVWGKKGKV